MLCPKCGYYSDREESVCPECGNILQYSSGIPKEGPQAIRQGKRAREAGRTRQEPSPKETAGRHARGSANRGAVMPGYTQLQRAQPITFAHHLLRN